MSVSKSPGHVRQYPFCSIWSSEMQENTSDSNVQLREHSPEKGAPIRGRTMKEYEEQLSQLKKENFNLKLRIYFWEERMSRDCEKDDLLKNNVELRTEVEALKKEKEDAQELLVKSHQLVELTDKQHKDAMAEKDREILALETRNKDLQTELQELKQREKIREKETDSPKASSKKAEEEDLDRKILELESALRLYTETIQSQELELEHKNVEVAEYEIALEEKAQEVRKLNAAIADRDTLLEELASKMKVYEYEAYSPKGRARSCSSPKRDAYTKLVMQKALEMEQRYKKLEEEYQRVLMDNHRLAKCIQNQARELEETQANIKQKEQCIRNFNLRTAAKLDRSPTRGEGGDDHLHVTECEKLEKKDLVEELEQQVKGLALALREKEQKLVDCEKDLLIRDNRIAELMSERCGREMGYWKRRVDELEARLRNTPERDESHLVMALRAEVLRGRQEIERAEVWQHEAGEKCGILMRRLEELAMFLRTLLTDGRLICGLNDKKRFLLKQIVDESMELSRNLSNSLFGTPDTSISSGITSMRESQQQSLLEFWSQDEEGPELINNVEVEDVKQKEENGKCSLSTVGNESSLISMTFYNSFCNRDNEPRKRLCSQSESEAWSEPDRNVSLARIGLPDGDVKPQENQESSESEDSSKNAEKKNLKNETRLKTLEKANESLRSELNAVYQLMASFKPPVQDASMNTSFHGKMDQSVDSELPVSQEAPLTISEELLDHVRRQHEKLEASLQRNEVIWRQLEKVVTKSENKEDKQQTTQLLEEQIQEMKKKEIEMLEQTTLLKDDAAKRELELTTAVEEKSIELQTSEKKRSELKRQLQLMDIDYQHCKEEKTALQKELDFLQTKCKKYEEDNNKIKESVSLLESKFQESDKLRLKFENELVSLEIKYQKSEEIRTELENKVKLLETRCNELGLDQSAISENLKTTERKLKYAQHINSAAKRRIQKLEEEKQKLLQDSDNRHRELEKKLEETEKLGSRLTAGMKYQSEREKEIKEAERRLQEKEKEMVKERDELSIKISQLEMRNACLENEKLHVESELHRMELLTEKSLSPRIRLASGSTTGDESSMEYRLSNFLCMNSATSKEHNHKNSKVTCDTNLWSKSGNQKEGITLITRIDRPTSRTADSPDLGIDSDHGRFSSMDATTCRNEESCKICCTLRKENTCLKQQQKQMQTLLEDMLSQLSTANHMKKQMGKAIFKELCKTKNVLKATRTKLEVSVLHDC